MKVNKTTRLILASGSPRRKELLEKLGFKIEVRKVDLDESYPRSLDVTKVAEYIANKKLNAFLEEEKTLNGVVITADTIVIKDGVILGKPFDIDEASDFLMNLSDSKHQVITGVCIGYENKKVCFSEISDVYFNKLETEDIEFYINNYEVLDKAGAYGIQEWIGLSSIEKINGSYTNIMGLPTQILYKKLKKIGIKLN